MKFLMSAVCALSLAAAISGCATCDENFIIQKGITDERVDLKNSSDFCMKNLEVLSKTDDNGLLTVDVTIEISRTSFWYWVFNGDPLLTLAYRFDWIDEQGRAASLRRFPAISSVSTESPRRKNIPRSSSSSSSTGRAKNCRCRI